MTDEIERLRRHGTADAEPDPAARATARAALMEAIEQAQEQAPPIAPTGRAARGARAARRPRRRLLAGAGGLLAAGAAAVAVALSSGVGDGDVRPQRATAAQVLRAAADDVARQQQTPLRAGQWYYVKTEGEEGFTGGTNGSAYEVTVPQTTEEWSAPGRWGRTRQATGTTPSFPTPAAKEAWTAAGRPWVGEVHDQRVAPSRASPGELEAGALGLVRPERLPTDAAVLEKRIDAAARAAIARASFRPDLSEAAIEDQVHQAVFTTAGALLAQPTLPVPPAVRAAAYRVMARVPGVVLLGPDKDALGRPGTVIALDVPGARNRTELVIEPSTGLLLELRSRIVGVQADPSTGRPPAGTTTRSTIVATGVVDSVRERP